MRLPSLLLLFLPAVFAEASRASRVSTPVSQVLARRSAAPSPTQTGLACNCNNYYDVVSGDTCSSIVSKYSGLTLSQFYQYNPAVGNSCQSLWVGYYVCVGVNAGVSCSSTSSSSSSSSSSPISSSKTSSSISTVQASTTSAATSSGPQPEQTGIAANCNAYYDVISGDTCSSIVSKFGNFTLSQFYSWNPAVGSSCGSLWVGYYVCIGVGAASTSTTKTTSGISSTAQINSTQITTMTSTIASSIPYSYISQTSRPNATYTHPTNITVTVAPSQTQAGINTNCAEWYLVQPQDSCQSIWGQYASSMSYAQFLTWNPALGANCTNLYVYNYVCVAVPVYTNTLTMTTATSQYYPPWIYTPPPSYTFDATPSPVPTGVVSNCQGFYQAELNDTCASIVSQYFVLTINTFEQINGAAANGTNCQVQNGTFYCIGTNTTAVLPPTVTVAPSPTQSGIAQNCNSWYQARAGDSCNDVAAMFSLNGTYFMTWNPAVGANCTGLLTGDYYCVGVGNAVRSSSASGSSYGTSTSVSSSSSKVSTPVSSSSSKISTAVSSSSSKLSTPISSSSSSSSSSIKASSISSSTASIPSPTASGIVSNCNKYYKVVSGDTCSAIASTYSITVAQFESWNAAINSGCTNLVVGNNYCVGVSGTSTSTSSVKTSSTTSKATSVTSAAPSPTASGVVSNCNAYYMVASGDSCSSIASKYGTFTVAQFESWNTGLNSQCTNLYAGYYYCVGVSGSSKRDAAADAPLPGMAEQHSARFNSDARERQDESNFEGNVGGRNAWFSLHGTD